MLGRIMSRRLELDALRGLMLVWMTLAHLPTIVSAFVNQPFGFVSGAEGFIFLSALFTGRIYSRIARRDGYVVMRRKVWLRAFRLYIYHALLLGAAFLLASRVVHGYRPGLHYWLDFYYSAGVKRGLLDGALLLYRPPLLDILPMYIIFLFLTPVALASMARFGLRPVWFGGFLLWLGAQFGLRQAIFNFLVQGFGLHVPLNEMGSFDLWAWQFLWVIGLGFGQRWANDDLPVEDWARRLLGPAAVLAGVLLALRYAVGRGVELGAFEISFDKWHLGAIRLIDLTAIGILLVRFQSALQRLAIRPLVMMGQASLQVFCVHLLFCFLGIILLGDTARVTAPQQAILLAATMSALLVTAKLFEKQESKTEADPPAPPPVIEERAATRLLR
jgi:hypothetical protein